jgi:hypothetical protein
MKHILIIIILICTNQIILSQIAATKQEIVEAFGHDYKEYKINFNEEYIVYKRETNTKASGTFNQAIYFYFLIGDNNPICFKYVVFEPITEFKPNIKEFSKLYTKLDNYVFLDRERNSIVTLKLEGKEALQTWSFNFNYNKDITELKKYYREKRINDIKSEKQRKKDKRKIKAAEGTYFN